MQIKTAVKTLSFKHDNTQNNILKNHSSKITSLKATSVAFVQQKIFSFKMIDMNDNEDNMKN